MGLISGYPGASKSRSGGRLSKLFEMGEVEAGDAIYVRIRFKGLVSGMWGVIHASTNRYILRIRHSPEQVEPTSVKMINVVNFSLFSQKSFSSVDMVKGLKR